MPTKTPKNKVKARRIPGRPFVKGIVHGLNGYTNYGCRCNVCTDGNSAHARKYRMRRYAGDPLCIRPGCPKPQAKNAGNGLCWSHNQNFLIMKEEDPDKAARVARRLGIQLREAA